MIAPSI